MYTKHFGLKKLPFENVPDPLFFFDHGDYARVRIRVRDSLKAGRGLIVVTGPIGSGKTTLSHMIKSDFSNDVKVIWMAEPPGNSKDLFLFIAQELGLKPSTTERIFVLRDIKDALLKINSEGGKCLMIIDESHLIADNILNGIRLLNNLEEGPTKLIQMLLLGQEELMERINRPDMESFKQRVAALETLGKMNAGRIRKYISHRIEVAGGHPSIFTDTGFKSLILAADTGGGVPRIINSLCDRSLNVAFEKGKAKVDVDDVYEVAEGMGIDKEVFHYRIALRSKEQKQQVPSAMENDSIEKPETLGKGPEPDISDIENENKHSETPPQSTGQESETGFSINKLGQKEMKIPIAFLFFSIAALIFSIFFYCQRSVSGEPMTCLLELIGF